VRKLGGIAILLFLLVVTTVGCDSGGQTEHYEYKPVDTAPLKDMQDAMIKNMKKPPNQRNKAAAAAPKAEEPAKAGEPAK